MPAGDGTRDDGADVLVLGQERRGVEPPRWSRWLLVPAVGVVAAVGLVHTEPTGPARPAPAASPAYPAAVPPVPPVAVTTVGHVLLPRTGGWELFCLGAGQLVRVEPAGGRVTLSAVPRPLSGAPVSLVVTTRGALVRSFDRVAGYVVPDGRPALALPSALTQGGPALPGPEPDTVWMLSDAPRPAMQLREVDGGRVRASIPVPEDASALEAVPDGTGYLILRTAGGVYRATPAGLRRITTGVLLAQGPTRWLTLECDDAYRCRPVVTDRATGARRTLPNALSATAPCGVIAPDGMTAAMFWARPDGSVRPYLLDLATGAIRVIREPFGRAADPAVDLAVDLAVVDGTVVWSPDSRWLLAAGTDGQILAIDPATAEVTMIGVELPYPTHLAVRPGR